MEHLEAIGHYWDGRAEGYQTVSKEEFLNAPGDFWRAIFRREIPAGGHVLDDGVGAGFFSMVLADLGYRLTSIDDSEDMVTRLKQNMADRGLPGDIRRMDAQHLEFPEQTFDAVVSRNMLWALEEPEQGYAEIARVLKPGGTLILEDANHYLYLYDEAYRAEADAMRERFLAWVKDHELPQNAWGNADPRVMEDLARDLPLSRKRRPAWDTQVLLDLGFRELRIVTKGSGSPFGRDTFFGEVESALPMAFYIIARKGGLRTAGRAADGKTPAGASPS